jgi:hypothetical protein
MTVDASLFDAIMRQDDQAFLRDAELFRLIQLHDIHMTLPDPTADQDDGKPWGFINEAGKWIQLPKKPFLIAGLGPPPFWVKMAWDEMRHIVHEPEAKPR